MTKPFWEIHSDTQRVLKWESWYSEKQKIDNIEQKIQASIANALEKSWEVVDISPEDMISYMVFSVVKELKDTERVRLFQETLQSDKFETGEISLTNNFHAYLPLATYWWDYVRDDRNMEEWKKKSEKPVSMKEYWNDIVACTYDTLKYFYSGLHTLEELQQWLFTAGNWPRENPYNILFEYTWKYRVVCNNIFSCINFLIFCKMINHGYNPSDLSS